MDRLQRRNPSSRPHSTSLKPPRPPRGPAFEPPPASRPLPELYSPDGRQRKKARFANEGEGGSHHIGGRHVANIREVAKNKPQVYDAKTAEYKFFKKFCEQSGHSSRLNKHSHQNIESKISKQRRESHNASTLRKLSVRGNAVCYDDPPATPAKNEEIHGEQANVQSSHSENGDKDTPQFNPHDCLPSIHILTPIAQTSFDVTGTSGNIDREPVSGQIFSEKRSKLLKIAAKTVSMGSAELFQRRSEFVGGILQRLGAQNIIRKQEGSMRHRKIDCRQAPAIPKGQFDNLLDYRQRDFDSSTKLRRTDKTPSSNASDDACEFMALPWGHNQCLPSFTDSKNDLPRGDSTARECMALPWVCVNDISSSDWKRGIVHNQVSNLLLEDVEPDIRRSASANELSLNVQSASHDQDGWSPMLSVKLTESFRDRLSFPCQIEEQNHTVPYARLNASWLPDHHSSTDKCISRSVGLERQDPKESGLCDNSDAGFSTRFDLLPAKSAASSFLDSGNEILENNDFRYLSHVRQSNNMVFSANTGYLNSMFSTLEHQYELGAKSLLDSAGGVSCLAGLDKKYSREVEPSDNSDRLLQVLDQLAVKFTPSSFPKESRNVDDRLLRYITSCPPDDNSSIFS